MTKKGAIAEVFVTAFKTLPEKDKETIVEELLSELEKDFSKNEWKKIQKLAKQNKR